jgi:NADPH:quinone reductase-like Zn-dependent oxidoreductase
MSEAWAQTVAIDYKTEDLSRAIREWSAEGIGVVLDVAGSTTSPRGLDMLRPGGRLVTVTADGDIERDRKEAEERVFARSPSLSTLSELRSQCGRSPI